MPVAPLRQTRACACRALNHIDEREKKRPDREGLSEIIESPMMEVLYQIGSLAGLIAIASQIFKWRRANMLRAQRAMLSDRIGTPAARLRDSY
ncbi:hypothetical protein DLM46_34160 [Paraburkholderia lacunae]|uniref:Uncharacterized protein n=1 Tax=Paraburkholderia lacunae TaxID=2211104 RepID=A0A370MYE4_9BURK|nr:hypothetical protein DLM46_34160 [Paraburkholderia lacunae]